MKRIGTEFDEVDRDTLILIPCSANKLSGGTEWLSGSDILWKSVPRDTYEKIRSSRTALIRLLNSNAKYTTKKYSKNNELCMGEDFGQNDTAGKYLPAIERYVGNLYRAHQSVVPAIREDASVDGKPKLLILSALYGPLHPLSLIQDYDLQMSDSPAKRIWMNSFAQFLEAYIESNGVRVVQMYFGSSTAYFKVGRAAVEPLLKKGKLDRAYQYNVVDGNSYHTPHNHGLLVLSALRKTGDLDLTRGIEVNEI